MVTGRDLEMVVGFHVEGGALRGRGVGEVNTITRVKDRLGRAPVYQSLVPTEQVTI